MGTRYTRRATKEGRFDRQDFGDLGLRAEAEWHKNVTDSLKVQRARQKEVDSDYAQSMGDVARNERENRQILQNLENEAYETRRQAMQVRADREVEALKGKAEEYGKKRDRWLNFSKTEAAKWGKLAEGAWYAADRITFEANEEEFYENLENQVELASKAQTNIEGKVVEASRNTILKGDTDSTFGLLGLLNIGGYNASIAYKDWTNNNKHKFPQLAEKAAEIHGEKYADNPTKWIRFVYERLGKQAGAHEGTKGWSEGLKEITAFAAGFEENSFHATQAELHGKEINGFIAKIASGDFNDPNILNNINAAYEGIKAATFSDGKGGWSTLESRGIDHVGTGGRLYAMVIAKKRYTNFNDSLEVLQKLKTDNGQSFYDRHVKGHEGEWLKIWDAQQKVYKATDQSKIKNNYNTTAAKINTLGAADADYFSSGKANTEQGFPHTSFNVYDINKANYFETREWLYNLKKQPGTSIETIELINKTLGWNSKNSLTFTTHERIKQLSYEGNDEGVQFILNNLTPTQLKEVNVKTNVDNHNAWVDVNQTKSKAERTSALRTVLSIGDTADVYEGTAKKKTTRSLEKIIPYAQVRLRQLFDGTDAKLSPIARYEAAIELLGKEVQEGKGIFENENFPTGRVFTHFSQENSGETYPVGKVGDTFEGSLINLANPQYESSAKGLESFLLNNKAGSGYKLKEGELPTYKFISKDDLDQARVESFSNRPIPQNNTIDFLAERFDVSRAEVWKQFGIDVKENHADITRLTEPVSGGDSYKVYAAKAKDWRRASFVKGMWNGKVNLGTFPVSDYTSNLINTFKTPSESASPLTLTTGLLSSTVRNELQAADEAFDLGFNFTEETGFSIGNPDNFIMNKEQFGGRYDAFENDFLMYNEPIWKY